MAIYSNGQVGWKSGVVAPSVDADAQAFITAANITNTTQQSAVNTLVTSLKSANIWTKMKAIYPFVGGTATTHKFNLKDPRDLDAAYRLVFNGGWTHSANGALPNGSNAFANTYFRPLSVLGNSDAHISKYNRNNDLIGNKTDGTYGVVSGNIYYIQQNYAAGNGIIGDSATIVSYTPTDTRGLFTTTRTSSTSVKSFRNTTQQGSTVTISNLYNTDSNAYLGARNDNGVTNHFNSYEAAFFSLGNGLNDAEVTALYNAVQAYQTTLGRQV
jgi:hypothetical protein